MEELLNKINATVESKTGFKDLYHIMFEVFENENKTGRGILVYAILNSVREIGQSKGRIQLLNEIEEKLNAIKP